MYVINPKAPLTHLITLAAAFSITPHHFTIDGNNGQVCFNDNGDRGGMMAALARTFANSGQRGERVDLRDVPVGYSRYNFDFRAAASNCGAINGDNVAFSKEGIFVRLFHGDEYQLVATWAKFDLDGDPVDQIDLDDTPIVDAVSAAYMTYYHYFYQLHRMVDRGILEYSIALDRHVLHANLRAVLAEVGVDFQDVYNLLTEEDLATRQEAINTLRIMIGAYPLKADFNKTKKILSGLCDVAKENFIVYDIDVDGLFNDTVRNTDRGHLCGSCNVIHGGNYGFSGEIPFYYAPTFGAMVMDPNTADDKKIPYFDSEVECSVPEDHIYCAELHSTIEAWFMENDSMDMLQVVQQTRAAEQATKEANH